MAGPKEYRSVTEFPLHLEQLEREALEHHYLELRTTYGSLTKSRGQLVRRQTEAKAKVAELQASLKRLNAAIAQAQTEKETLKASLAHNTKLRHQLETWGNSLAEDVDDLNAKMFATAKLLGDFEAVYEDVQANGGILSIGKRFSLLLNAVKRLLNTDIADLITQPQKPAQGSDWADDSPSNINKSLHDGSA